MRNLATIDVALDEMLVNLAAKLPGTCKRRPRGKVKGA